ncbi:hypothetical protein P692DRAFT_20895012 [Suillus brevipes Sb2]|nr:hypothetical protein P692DRAFT_20895012 [Suillus brevipes Sb2]
MTAAKRRQVEPTHSNVLRDSPYIDPFQPAAAPYDFEPEMTVRESEELTRQLQHQELATATEGSREKGRPGDGYEIGLGDAADADEDKYDSDAAIDLILRNDSQRRQHEPQDFIPASQDNRKQLGLETISSLHWIVRVVDFPAPLLQHVCHRADQPQCASAEFVWPAKVDHR